MAAYPCSIGLHRYNGAQRSAYVTMLNGSHPVTRKLRLCPRHYEEVAEYVTGFLQALQEDGQMSPVCEACGGPRETTMFARLYPGGEGESQFVSDLCLPCATKALAELHWDASMAL